MFERIHSHSVSARLRPCVAMGTTSQTKRSGWYYSKRRLCSWIRGGANSPAARCRTFQVVVLLLIIIITIFEFLSGGAIKTKFTNYMDPTSSLSDAQLAASEQLNTDIKADSTDLENNSKDLNVSENNTIPLDISELLISINSKVNPLNTELDKRKPIDDLENTTIFDTDNEKAYCDEVPPGLGPIRANKSPLTLEEVEMRFPEVQTGGYYTPPNCTARHKVAIIVPFRNRAEHLTIFLNHMHPFLMKQQIEYGIFVVEQEGDMLFNRAKLKNVGVVESQKLKDGGWQCYVFHDVDLLPLDERILYTCPEQPRHMSVAVDSLTNQLPYNYLFGGAIAMTVEQFKKVNGFSNNYWGWGAEDDDMTLRLKKCDYHIDRYNTSISRYTMLEHAKERANPGRYLILSQTEKQGFEKDGLSTLRYELKLVTKYHLFTHILADIHTML